MRIAIIGGGVAGLAAAIEAGRHGAEAVVFDAREHPGGRARTHCRHGFLLNEGAHALYTGGPAMAWLRELGREPDGGAPDAGAGVGIDGDVVGRFPVGLVSLLRTPLLARDRRRIARLLAGLGRTDPARFARSTVEEAMTGLLGTGPAARLGLALARLTTYGNDPAVASADAVIAQLRLTVSSGVRYVDGGWQTIVDGLLDEVLGRGGGLRPATKVDAVVPTDGAVEVVTGGGGERFDAVVIAAGGPAAAARMLGPVAPVVGDWAAAARPATVACLDVGLAAPWGPHPPFALGIDEPLYLSVHAPVARLAPEGATLVHVMRYHHPDGDGDGTGTGNGSGDADRARCERLLDRIRPGWRADARHVGFAPRLVAAHDQPRAADGGLAGRPGPAVPGLDRVFVAGDWVGPVGTLVDASVHSGRDAGRLAAALRPAVVV